jgi:hypothetical protein
MSFFDQVYDDMSWNEVCYRLPSDLAINALQRRINNLDTLRMFFDSVGSQPVSVQSLKEHVNAIISDEDPEDILDTFEKDYEKTLFNWLDNTNRKRIKDHDPDKLSTKFLFNATDSDDDKGLKVILDRVLNEDPFSQAHLRAVLGKTDDKHFNSLIDTVLRDSRPEVRVCVLGVSGLSNKSLISDHQKVIGLKALVKCGNHRPVTSMSVLNVGVFGSLRPLERLSALETYFSYFPKYRKIQAFDPAPTQEEFDMILFAGCIEHNDKVTKLHEAYKLITEEDAPEPDVDEESV